MSQIKCQAIRFAQQIENPHKPYSQLREECIPTLRQGSPHSFTVEDEAGWIKITGKARTIWTPRTNVVAIIPADEADAKKAGK